MFAETTHQHNKLHYIASFSRMDILISLQFYNDLAAISGDVLAVLQSCDATFPQRFCNFAGLYRRLIQTYGRTHQTFYPVYERTWTVGGHCS